MKVASFVLVCVILMFASCDKNDNVVIREPEQGRIVIYQPAGGEEILFDNYFVGDGDQKPESILKIKLEKFHTSADCLHYRLILVADTSKFWERPRVPLTACGIGSPFIINDEWYIGNWDHEGFYDLPFGSHQYVLEIWFAEDPAVRATSAPFTILRPPSCGFQYCD